MARFKIWLLALLAVLLLGLVVGRPTPAAAQNICTYVDINGAKQYCGHATPMPVSGRVPAVSVTPTVTASSAYASGNVIGGLLTFTGAVTADNPTGVLTEIRVHMASAQTADMDFALCGQNPSSSTITDKAAISLAAADAGKCRAYHISGSSCIALGTPTECALSVTGPFTIPTGTSLYGFLVARGAMTFTSTADVTVGLGILR